MQDLTGRVAWVTGAGSGIGEAAALSLARAGAHVVLTGRRKDALEAVAAVINADRGKVSIQAGDLTKSSSVTRIVSAIVTDLGRIDIVVNNAGVNIPERNWERLKPDGIDTLVQTNLTAAFYVVQAILPVMRAQQDGVLIHTSSWSGRFIGGMAGPVYTAAKHGVVAMSHTINIEECNNGIRSTVICPGEVATPIMALRDPPELPETMARMLQPADMAEIILFVARQPRHVCMNEIIVAPTHNRGYLSVMRGRNEMAAETRSKAGRG